MRRPRTLPPTPDTHHIRAPGQAMAGSPATSPDPADGSGRTFVRGALAGVLIAMTPLGACGANAGGEAGPEARAEEGAPDGEDGQAGPGRGMAWVVLGTDTVRAEVASTAEERRTGLMNRDEVPDGTGMLFVFPDEGVRSFWMANTYVPLDIAFLDSSATIVDIKQMAPETTDLTESDAAAMFALEVRQGWFEENGIGVGVRAEIVFGPR